MRLSAPAPDLPGPSGGKLQGAGSGLPSGPQQQQAPLTKRTRPELEREIAKVSASWSERAFFTLPSGAKVFLKQWQLPDAQSLRDAFKTSLILLNLPQKNAVHVDPMRVTAVVQPKTPVGRAQLQLPPAMNPLWVVLKTDKFWLTDQIPMAIVELD